MIDDELQIKYRPKDFDEIYGQEKAVEKLQGFKKKYPHFMAFVGPSGTGKTTFARIISSHLECSKYDFLERNCALERGINDAKDIERIGNKYPLKGKNKVILLDEAHRMTPDAQAGLLKLMEEPPKHLYLMVATTNFEKMLRAIQTRATVIHCTSIEDGDIEELLKKVAKKEEIKINDAIIAKIVECASGSAREALVFLNGIRGIKGSENKLNAIQSSGAKLITDKLGAMFLKKGVQWKEVASLIRQIDEEPETMRRMILGYMNAVLLNAGGSVMGRRASEVIDVFSDHFYDSGAAGLTNSCFELIVGK